MAAITKMTKMLSKSRENHDNGEKLHQGINTNTRLYCVDWFSNQESEYYGKNDIFLHLLEPSAHR